MRIITGISKGLKLKTPSGLTTRPTSDRVKESLFSVLNGLVNFSEVDAVLDIFAGTGALGLEALSRGVKSAVFIDLMTADIICENVRRAKFIETSTILRGDFHKLLRKLSKQNKKFELVFSDAPYNSGLAQASIELVANFDLLEYGGLFVVEHGADETFEGTPEVFDCIRHLRYGHTTSTDIYQRRSILS